MSLAEAVPETQSRRRAKPASRKTPAKAKTSPGKRAPSKKSAAKKRPAKLAAAKRVPTAPAQPEIWTAQFIYADAGGATRISLMEIEAVSIDAARAFAAAHAPAAEFMLSLHPRSDEQFLGQVRNQALAAAKAR